MNKPMDELLGISSANNENMVVKYDDTPTPGVYDITADPNFLRDFVNTRKELIRTLDMAKDASQKMQIIANESDKSRDFEVLNTILKTRLDASKSILEIYDRKQNISSTENNESSEQGPTYVQNAIFVGTTGDLKKALLELKQEEEEKDADGNKNP